MPAFTSLPSGPVSVVYHTHPFITSPVFVASSPRPGPPRPTKSPFFAPPFFCRSVVPPFLRIIRQSRGGGAKNAAFDGGDGEKKKRLAPPENECLRGLNARSLITRDWDGYPRQRKLENNFIDL